MRIIVDTNWYISLLIKKNESRLYSILLNPAIDLIISDQLLNELTGKIGENKFRKYFAIEYGLKFIDTLKLRASNVKVTSQIFRKYFRSYGHPAFQHLHFLYLYNSNHP